MAAPFSIVAGIIFLVVAAWGFIDGERVLIFHVNTAHNIVHLLSGAAALTCGLLGERPAKLFLIGFGAVYTLVAILGFAGVGAAIEFLHLNAADNWLHLALGLAFLLVGLASAPRPARAPIPVAPATR